MTQRSLARTNEPCPMIKRRTSPKLKLSFQESAALEVLTASFKSQLRVNAIAQQSPNRTSGPEPSLRYFLSDSAAATLLRPATPDDAVAESAVVEAGNHHWSHCLSSKRVQPTASRRRMLRRGSKCPSMFHGMDRLFLSSATLLESFE